jgi:hypothetical protein
MVRDVAVWTVTLAALFLAAWWLVVWELDAPVLCEAECNFGAADV